MSTYLQAEGAPREASTRPPTLAEARSVLSDQPFSVLLGARICDLAPGEATLVLPMRAELRQQHGFVHGGVIAYLADNAITFAGGSLLGRRVVTGSVSVDYVRPATGDLVATATVVTASARSAVVRCEIAVDDRVCAVAHGSVRLLGGSAH